MRSENDFYVYVLFRPWNGEPCYVGKGRGYRVKRHDRFGVDHRNMHMAAIIKKANGPLPAVLIHEGLSEDVAFEYEIALIAAIGRRTHGGPLANATNGGEGPIGHRHSAKTRAILGEKSKKSWSDPSSRKNHIAGSKSGWAGNDERKKKVSEKAKEMWANPEIREKIIAIRKQVWRDPKRREARRLHQIEVWKNPDRRAKGSAASKRMWENFSAERMEKICAARSAKSKNMWDNASPEKIEAMKAKMKEAQQRRRAREREAKTQTGI